MALTADIPQSPQGSAPSSLFKRRFSPLHNSTNKPVRRCLFGSPDPVETSNLPLQIFRKGQLQFSKRWNFPVIPIPTPKKMTTNKKNKNDRDNYYEWEKLCDFQYPADIQDKPPLFYAGTGGDLIMKDEGQEGDYSSSSGEIKRKKISNDLPPLLEPPTTPTSQDEEESSYSEDSHTSESPNIKLVQAPSSSSSSLKDLSCFPQKKNKCNMMRCIKIHSNNNPTKALNPNNNKTLRQRAITDYVQVKKKMT